MTTEHEKGLALFGEVYGPETAKGLAAYLETDGFGVNTARWANDFCFGTVWSDGMLERKLRSCVVLGMMIALRQSDEIRYHTKMGIANGLTREEIEGVLHTTVPYCGLPASNVAKASMLAAFQELDEAAATRSGE